MKKYALGCLLVLLPLSVSAATFQTNETIDVATGGNAYALGKVVQVTSEVAGDVYLAGENVNINARAREDAFLAGRNVTLNAPIGDDLHVFGETIIINDDIRGDLIAFGSTVIISPDSRISGDVVIGAERISADGQFDSSVRLMGSHIELQGIFLKDVDIRTGHDPAVSADADIRGNLHLLLPEGITGAIPAGVVRGEIIREVMTGNSSARKGSSILSGIRMASLVSHILVGAILIMFLRNFALKFGENITQRKEYLRSFVMAFLALTLPPFVAALLFITFFGIPIAVIFIVGWGTLVYFASLLSGLLLANIFLPLQKTDSTILCIGKFTLGTFALSLVKIIPYIGFSISFIIFLLSVGALCDFKISTIKALRKSHHI
ncbi:MAG TPA: hypothetical protein VJB82_01600 [Candidatus Peribacterales bacterium]|nr:hypothetical protein [Candidatus Peribacterales bacterium]